MRAARLPRVARVLSFLFSDFSMKRTPPLAILVTGGTFDKGYDPLAGILTFGAIRVPEILAGARLVPAPRVRTVMLKDSLEMTDADRRKILAACVSAKEKHLVITHGTDTMALTARFLATHGGMRLAGKTIVLTGAMVPFAVQGSDAAFNLGAAVAFARALPTGVHVAMNGRALAWDKVEKDRKRGVFVES